MTKGDWRSISRYCALSRTPSQVASHAQKHFLRLNKPKKRPKDRRRPFAYDKTTSDNKYTSAPQGPIAAQLYGATEVRSSNITGKSMTLTSDASLPETLPIV